MWSDNETEKDFLNFSGVAGTVAEVITQAAGKPISIGISGSWGAGKSSMIKLVRNSIASSDKESPHRFIFVQFNAWLYQGYDDARAALLEVIATELQREAERQKSDTQKIKELFQRVNWLRVAKLSEGALALAFGLPPVGLISRATDVAQRTFSNSRSAGDSQRAQAQSEVGDENTDGLLKAKPEYSPPKEIKAIRETFEQTLKELKVTLVVLIDDLDRCLPSTTISTLEAIRLFLFLENTAFVIAADDTMIKHAVRQHFGDVEGDLVSNYFDKLVQVPIRVPPLGTQEVRAYLILLFVEQSKIAPEEKESIRQSICDQLAKSWRGEHVDRAFARNLFKDSDEELIAHFDTADRLARIMVTASQISGNPRLVKRFLNALSIRMAISRAHDVGVDEAVLAKILLLERCGDPKAYNELTTAVNNDSEGKPTFLAKWERETASGKVSEREEPWDGSFVSEWLATKPPIADVDLRGALYVSREHAPLITPEDRLSPEGAVLLSAILEKPRMANSLLDGLKALPTEEINVLMDQVLEQARREQKWGVPPILDACIALAEADTSLGSRLARFLIDRPFGQITASIVPKIADRPWSKVVLKHWEDSAVSDQVKKTIRATKSN